MILAVILPNAAQYHPWIYTSLTRVSILCPDYSDSCSDKNWETRGMSCSKQRLLLHSFSVFLFV